MDANHARWTTELPTRSGFYFWRSHAPLPGEHFNLGRWIPGNLTQGVVHVKIDPTRKTASQATIAYWTDFLECLGGEWWSERIAEPPDF